MLKLFIFTLIFFLSVNGIPQVIPLYSFSSLADYNVKNVEPGSKLYLASNDDSQYLKNIKITSGFTSITLDQINELNTDGTPKFFPITDNLIVSTSNTDSITTSLFGNFFITAKSQADNSNFLVYVIKNSHKISAKSINSTVMILNTKLLESSGDYDQPRRTSYVTDINQSDITKLNFLWGIPMDNEIAQNYGDEKNNTFFRNPIELRDEAGVTEHFYNHIEPLQVNLDYWYFTATGPVSMKIENKYVSNHNYTTTAVSTTGIVVNNFIYKEHVVNFIPDLTLSGTAGVFTSAYITRDLGIYMNYDIYSGISNKLNDSSETQTLFFTYAQATKLTINSTTTVPGDFYCQYFSFSRGLRPNPPTVEPPTTTVATTTEMSSSAGTSTTTIATTTKGASGVFRLKFLIVFFAVVLGLH